MKLRLLARITQVRSGNSILFWHYNWTDLGPLIAVVGDLGPLVSRISSTATVSSVCFEGCWQVSRSRHPLLTLLRACLPADFLSSLTNDSDFFFNGKLGLIRNLGSSHLQRHGHL